MHVLLVEDDNILADGMRSLFEQHNCAVTWTDDAAMAKRVCRDGGLDAMVLDLTLPRSDGLDLLGDLRRSALALPVVIVTARAMLQEKVRALEMGADDYVVKPFEFEELYARLRAVCRRFRHRTTDVMRHGELELDLAAFTVHLAGDPVKLSRREFSILEALMDNAGKVVTRQRLEHALYGLYGDVSSNTLDVYIHNLRKKLAPGIVRTVHGLGYMLQADPE